jgi:hypothetical protein
MGLHARSATGHLPALFQTLHLALAIGIRLAPHIVVIVRAAPGTDEEGRAHERSGRCADFLDFRDVIGERGGVDEHLLVESEEESVTWERRIRYCGRT